MNFRMNVIIRQEAVSDYPAVGELNRLAFNQESEAKLVDALRKNESVFIPELSIVAETDNEIVGYILFTRIEIVEAAIPVATALALAPVAVTPSFQGKGIGGRLIGTGLAKAASLGFGSVIVLGHQSYYPRFGFLQASKWNIKCPYDVPVDVFMARELLAGALENVSGTVRYPKEFDEV